MPKTILVGFALATALAGSTASARQTVTTRVILASVTDSDNRPLVDIGPDDFVIEERGEEREVLDVYIADYPIVVILDNSSNAQRDIQILREATASFVKRIGQRPVAFATLTDPPQLLGSFASSQAEILDRILGLAIAPTSVTRPVYAVAMAVEAIQNTSAPFSAIVVVSAGGTTASQPESTDLLHSIFSSRTIVHAITRGVPPAARQDQGHGQDLDESLLRDLVDQTGGRLARVFAAASYSIALDQVADRLATEMMIQYLVPTDSDAGPEVRVGVRVPGGRVHGLGVTQ